MVSARAKAGVGLPYAAVCLMSSVVRSTLLAPGHGSLSQHGFMNGQEAAAPTSDILVLTVPALNVARVSFSRLGPPAAGILLWELCTGEAPNRGTLRALTPADCPQEVAALQQQCMQREPHLRPSAAQILEILGSLESTEPQPQQLPAQHGSPAPKPLPPQPTAGAATPGAAAAPAHGATTAPLRRCVRFPPACSSPSPLFVASACSSVGAASKASSQTSQKVEEDEEDSSEEEEAINNSVGLVCTATS